MTVFVFDIETVPDVEGARRLHGLQGLSDEDVVKAMTTLRRQETGRSDFLRHHLHQVVVISIAMRGVDRFKVWSIGDADSPEGEVIGRFFEGIERFTPTLVSWNGSGFDLPVLHYRAMIHKVAAPRYWETGNLDQSFRWNNYQNRFHERHTDLMDVISGYQGRAVCALDEIATLCGFPGKMGMSGAKVWEYVNSGRFDEVRDYCETDVLNTYLVYLRFQLMRGQLGPDDYERECALVKETLVADDKPHFRAFLDAWNADSSSTATE